MSGPVLVTGAGGFIGRHLVGALARAGWSVRAGTRTPDALPPAERVTPFCMPDISGTVDWGAVLDGVTHVVHLAGLAHANGRIPDARYMAVNARPVRALAQAAREAGARRVLLVSSVRAQTGPAAPDVLTEAAPPIPTDAYGRSKLAAEHALAEVLAGSTTDWIALRPVLVYGPGVAGNMRALYSLARSPLPLPLAGLPGRRSLLSVANACAAIVHLLSARNALRRAFLAADAAPVTVEDIVRAIRSGLGRQPRLFRVPAGPAALAARILRQRSAWERLTGDLVVDTTALRALGWAPAESTEEGLSRWVRAERDKRSAPGI